jgi:hypothetical protein
MDSLSNHGEVLWSFDKIIGHQGPLTKNHPEYKGDVYNVVILWTNGEQTAEPLSVIAKDDFMSCVTYAQENGLLETAGWKRFKSAARKAGRYLRLANLAKMRTTPKFKYGVEIPRHYHHAIQLDQVNGNTKWQEAIDSELQSLDKYHTFEDLGHRDHATPPCDHQKLRVHFVFDVKHDGRLKARLVADGHRTEIPDESVYSGVVSLRGIRLVIFLAELNNLALWTTDVSNAYLEAFTKEKLYVEAGPELGGHRLHHILVIKKALYGLRTSGARWHDRLSDVLRDMGFLPCRAEPDVWMRKTGQRYEYIAVYVDDLAMAMVNPKDFVQTLENKYNFCFKGTGPISFHLGMDVYREDDGTLCITSKKYIERILLNYEKMFGKAPKLSCSSPILKGDHPETDDTDLLDDAGVKDYQSLIGALQWLVSIGRFDIHTAVMTLSAFRSAPRIGHMDRVKRVFGYLYKMKHGIIRIRTQEPDYSDLPDLKFDWSRSVYGEPKEIIPTDAPAPLGKFVTTTHYVDANLMHDLITGRSVTGILHLVNKTPIDWFSKKQAMVETATYGSEFIAARSCIEQIVDLHNTLRYLGVPIRAKSFMFGDNQSVVTSSTTVNAKLHKRHNMLSFHRVREAIASNMVAYHFIPGQDNPADVLSKHWGYDQVWRLLQPLLFWQGDTSNLHDKQVVDTHDEKGSDKV